MLNKIIAFSLRNRLAVIFLTLGLIGGGIYAFTQLPIDAVPDITNNQVQILTSAPAYSPIEVEQFIAVPLELALKTLPDILELRSLSQPGLSVITLVFADNVDLYLARQLVHERLAEAAENLPPAANKPELAPISTGLGEIFRYIVKDTTGRLTPMDLRTVQDWIIRKQLQGVPGLAEVNSLGGEVKQLHVLVDPQALNGYGLTLRQVFDAVSSANGNAGGAYIEDGAEQYNVRSVGLLVGGEDLKSAVVKTMPDGTPITLGAVARIQTGPALRFGAASQDGKGEVVTGITMQLKGANSRVTVQGVKSRLEEIKAGLPPGVVIEPYYDREVLVDRTIKTVFYNMLEGALLVVVVLLLFLANLRAGLILASVIPLTMLFAAICMVLTGQTGNLMSLGAIDFGLVVDGSLIIVESCLMLIALHLEQTHGKALTGDELKNLLYGGSTGVLQAAKFGVLIIIIVYLPILTLQGVEGKFFRPMALTVSFALIGALLLSVTYVPMMCYYFLPRSGHIKESKLIDFLRRRYEPMLIRAFAYRKRILYSVGGLLAIAVVLFIRLGGEFIPRLDEGDMSVSVLRLPAISLTESLRLSTEVERRLKQFPEVITVVSHTGRSEISTDPMGVEASDAFVILKPEDEWKTKRTKAELIEAMSASLSDVPGIGVQFLQPIEMRMNELIAGLKGDVAIKIVGDDFSVLNPAAQKVAAILRSINGAADVTVEQTTGLPQLVIKAKRDQIARFGLSIADINEILASAVGGVKAGEILDGERRSDIVVRFTPESRSSADAIRGIQLPTMNGERVTLGSVADVTFEDAPAQISREGGSRFISIQANVRDRDVESFVKEVQSKIESTLKLPPGYFIKYGGQFENLKAASKRLMIVVPISLLLIFILLYQTFKRFSLALMVFFCVPLAVIGGIGGLVIGGLPFSISAGIGFIALFGIAVLNGIVMVAAILKHHTPETAIQEAIVAGSLERFRPVVTTAALAGLGFLPMLIGTGAGSEVQRPLATVIIGGLVSSTLLTLFVLPLVYPFFTRFQLRGKKDRRAALGGSAALLLVALALPRESFGQLLQLEDLQRIAVEHSPEIERITAESNRERALVRAAGRLPSPEVFYSFDERGKGLPGTTALGVKQSFEFPLVYFARSRAQNFSLLGREAQAELVRREMTLRVAAAYLSASMEFQLLKMADSNVATAQRFSMAVTKRHKAGAINALEALQPSVALSNAVRQRSAALVNFERSMGELRTLTGITSADSILLEVDSTSSPQPFVLARDSLREWLQHPSDNPRDIHNPLMGEVALKLWQNPTIAVSSYEIEAAKTRENILNLQLLPALSLEASRQTIAGSSGYFGASLGFEIPIWKWLNSGERTAAAFETATLEAERNIRFRQLSLELRNAIGQYERAAAEVNNLEQDLLPKAREAARIALRLNELGEATYFEVLAAQAALIEAERSVIELRTEAKQAALLINYFTVNK